jgi:hypothetical protein
MNAEDVATLIRAAFPVEPLPGISLHQAQLADQSMAREISESEWKAAGELDAGRTWLDLRAEDLIACDAALSHFDEASFVYHIPAFMLFAVHHRAVEWKHPAWSLVGGIVFSLTNRSAYSLGRYKRFTSDQRKAVISFLAFIAEDGRDSNASDAQKALDRYWMTDDASKPLIIVP